MATFDERFPQDREQRINGVKYTYPLDGQEPDDESAPYLVIAAWMNPVHSRAITNVRRGREQEIDEGKVSLNEEDRGVCTAMAQGVLRGWGGWDDLPEYSEKAAEEALFYRLNLRDEVVDKASRLAMKHRQEARAAGKS